jgi:hypothetical protein
MQEVRLMKKILIALVPTVLSAVSASAQDLEFSNGSRTTATFYGQINLTYQGVDDGEETYSDFVDNSNSTSRIGVRIELPYGDGDLSFNFETGLGIENTAETSQIDDNDWIDWQRTDIRKLETAYGGSFGKVWIGQGSMATDGAAEIDNSGTSVAGYVNLADSAGSYQFRDGTELSGITIGDAFKDFDGGRRLRIRYDTPEWNSLTFSVAYGDEVLNAADKAEYYDVAMRYGYDNEALAFESAIGYSWKDDVETTEYLIASGSLLHKPTGLNLTLAAGDNQGGDGSYYFSKIGWIGEIFSVGETAFAVDYYDGQDFVLAGSSSGSWGIEAVQMFDSIGMEAYVGYRSYSYDDNSAADFQDLSSLLAGGRWRF